MNISKGKLKNGLKYLSVHDKESKSVSIIFLLKVGSRVEEPNSSGLAHFIEHNFFKGTTNYPTSKKLGMAIENLGGSSNAFTSYEYTGYYIKSPKEKFGETIELLADIIRNPLFPSAELEKEKGVIIEEIKMYEDIPMSKVSDIFMERLFPNHSLGRDIAGSIDTVSSFKKSDVTRFISEYYTASNSLISVAGGVDNKHAEEKISELFSFLKRGKEVDYDKFEKVDLSDRSISIEKDVEQTHIVIGGYGYDRFIEEESALNVCFTILGSGFGSILFQVIREELGLAYYINAKHSEFDEVGLWKVRMGVDNNRFEEAVERLILELKKFSSGQFDQEDLDTAKNFYIGKLITQIETSEEIAMWYGMQELLENRIKNLEKIKKEVKSLEKDDILGIWSELLKPDNIIITSLGPKKLDSQGILSNIIV